MIVLDANLLLYAYDPRSPFYDAARRWLGDVFSYEDEVGIPFQSILAFVRVSTHVSLASQSFTMRYALEAVDGWLALANVKVLTPGQTHWEIFKKLCLTSGISGDVSTDVHIAALAIEHDAILCSVDRDFARFLGLRWRNPLEL